MCGNSYLPLGQIELGAPNGRTLNLLSIAPCVHHPGKGGVAGLLMQRGSPIVEMGHYSVTAVKGMAISPRIVHLRISKR